MRIFLPERGRCASDQPRLGGPVRSIREEFAKINNANMPEVTAHVCRHTFCAEMLRRRMKPGLPKNLVGHKEIGATVDTYAHSGGAEAEMRRTANAGWDKKQIICTGVPAFFFID